MCSMRAPISSLPDCIKKMPNKLTIEEVGKILGKFNYTLADDSREFHSMFGVRRNAGNQLILFLENKRNERI